MKRLGLVILLLVSGLLLVRPAQAARRVQRVGGTPTPTSSPTPTITPTPTPALILQAPLPGQALQGKVAILGSTGRENFSFAVLEFCYLRNPRGTWFPLAEIDVPVQDGLLGEWDTSTISDGVYTLRLTVVHMDGERESLEIYGLRVRNYSPIETDTPAPILPSATPQPGDTPIPSPSATPTQTLVPPTGTAFPLNPARLSPGEVLLNSGRGALAVLGLFALGLLYALVRGLRRHNLD